MIGRSIIGLKDEDNISGYNDLLGEDNPSLVKEESFHSLGMIGLNKGVSITEKYLSSEAKVEKNSEKEEL